MVPKYHRIDPNDSSESPDYEENPHNIFIEGTSYPIGFGVGENEKSSVEILMRRLRLYQNEPTASNFKSVQFWTASVIGCAASIGRVTAEHFASQGSDE